MHALYKVALATALALSLAGTATALATSNDAPAGHTGYVTLTLEEDPDRRPALEGNVPCEAGLAERTARALLGKPACEHAGYAYAYPGAAPPPWEGDVQWVNTTTHIADDTLRHAVVIQYEAVQPGEDGGVETWHATAGELVPNPDGSATYSVPVADALSDDTRGVELSIGPEPSPTVEAAPPAEGT